MKWFIILCILLVLITVAEAGNDARYRYRHRNRHRHRHRHRHRAFYQQQSLDAESDFHDLDLMLKEFEMEQNTLSDGPTLRQDVANLSEKNITFPKSQDFAEALRSQHRLITDMPVKNLEDKVLDSLTRALNFYGSHLDDITKGDSSLSLKTLKDIDDKHGQILQKNFPLDQWIQRNCDNTIALNPGEELFCMSLVRQWKNRSGTKTSANMEYWKPASVLESHLSQIDHATLENIGTEKEGLWKLLNVECQEAVVTRCEIPYICERTLLDPMPRSQYLLTHQLIQRLFIDNSDCPNLQPFVTEEETYEKLCTKAYMEAQFLDLLDVPILQRDLFAELVGFCGYLGYTNFFREDWLDRILSWQSESDFGCFIKDPLTPAEVISTDMELEREATQKELEQGVEQTNEKCLPHLTAVALTAVSAYWDYLMDLKSHQLRVEL